MHMTTDGMICKYAVEFNHPRDYSDVWKSEPGAGVPTNADDTG
jgi:hypothetical protein